MTMRLRRGVDPELESEADKILFPILKEIRRPSERDVLTHYMETSRRNREVYVSDGFPDASVRRGQFSRSYNPAAPHLNSRDRVSRTSRFVDGRRSSLWSDGASE